MRKAFLSLGVAVAIVLLSYFVANIPYPLLDSWMPFSFVELTGRHLSASYPEDSVLCVNVAYDKQLADAYSKAGFKLGHSDVTDRGKLLRFLQIAKQADYRYIFLDVRFPEGLKTENDEDLFSLIEGMPRLVLSNHSSYGGYSIADSSLLSKSALADYRMTAFTGFTRYQYLQHGQESVALRMYRDMDGGDIRKFGPFYFSGGWPCRNSQFVRIPKFVMEQEREDYTLRYPYLGAHYLDWNTDEELARSLKGKIILIGDFDEDLHQTYVGDVPGAMLSFLGWWELHTSRHIVPVWLIITLLILYSLIVFLLLTPHRNWYDYVPLLNRIKSPFWRFILSLVGWGFVLTLLQMALYRFAFVAISTAVPAFCFSLLGEINHFRESNYTI